jgi:hypothetical protein
MACSLLSSQSRNSKQNLLEIDDIETRIAKVTELLIIEIEDIKKRNTEFDKTQGATIRAT